MGDVVEHADVDAACLRRDEARLQELGRLAVETDVVEGELEAPLGRSRNATTSRATSSAL